MAYDSALKNSTHGCSSVPMAAVMITPAAQLRRFGATFWKSFAGAMTLAPMLVES